LQQSRPTGSDRWTLLAWNESRHLGVATSDAGDTSVAAVRWAWPRTTALPQALAANLQAPSPPHARFPRKRGAPTRSARWLRQHKSGSPAVRQLPAGIAADCNQFRIAERSGRVVERSRGSRVRSKGRAGWPSALTVARPSLRHWLSTSSVAVRACWVRTS